MTHSELLNLHSRYSERFYLPGTDAAGVGKARYNLALVIGIDRVFCF